MIPTFSIIIPVYNVAPYLRECLDSVLAAANALNEKCGMSCEKCGSGVEIICVDDGCTDGSGAILDEYVGKVEKLGGGGEGKKVERLGGGVNLNLQPQPITLCVIHQANKGVSAARNAALDVATGEYVAFIDGDDTVEVSWMDDFAELIRLYPDVDWIRTSYQDVVDGNCLYRKANKQSGFFQTEIECMIWENLYISGTMWVNVFRRKILSGMRLNENLIWREDTNFCASLIPMVNSLAVIDAYKYRYRILSGSAAHRKLRFEDVARAMEQLVDTWIAHPVKCPSFQDLLFKCVRQCYESGYKFKLSDSWTLRRIMTKAWRNGAISFAGKAFLGRIGLMMIVFLGFINFEMSFQHCLRKFYLRIKG